MDNADKLLKLKKEIETAKSDKARLEGKLQSLHEQLQENYGLNSIEEVNQYLITIDQQLEELNKQLDTGMQELEKEFVE